MEIAPTSRGGESREQLLWWGKTPFEVSDYDNPETIRFRTYATGAHLLIEANPLETKKPRATH